MKLPSSSVLIEKACSRDASRPVLNSVYLERMESGPIQARLLATDGRIAAIVPVVVTSDDKAGYIPTDALKASRKHGGEFTANGACTMPDGQTFARPDHGKYPNIEQVIPKGETKFSVSLDPELLYAVAQAIGSERGVTLEFSAEGHALRVRPCFNPRAESAKGKLIWFSPAHAEAMGLIMPIAKQS